jgi:hypothetical protein
MVLMTPMRNSGILQLVADRSVSVVACDVPVGMTLAEYRVERRPRPRRRRDSRASLRRSSKSFDAGIVPWG